MRKVAGTPRAPSADIGRLSQKGTNEAIQQAHGCTQLELWTLELKDSFNTIEVGLKIDEDMH